MEKTPDYKTLLTNAFGVQKQVEKPKSDPLGIKPPDPIAKPEPVQTRDKFDPMLTGSVQAFVWKDGMPPAPKAPTAKTMEVGTTPAMGNQSGWGKI